MRPWVICPLYIFSAYPGPWNIHRRLFTKANFNNMNDYVCVNVHIFYTPIVCKSASFANILRRTLWMSQWFIVDNPTIPCMSRLYLNKNVQYMWLFHFHMLNSSCTREDSRTILKKCEHVEFTCKKVNVMRLNVPCFVSTCGNWNTHVKKKKRKSQSHMDGGNFLMKMLTLHIEMSIHMWKCLKEITQFT